MRQNIQCYLGLGANLGEPARLFDQVVNELKHNPLASCVRESARFESSPIDATGPNYLNSVIEMHWQGSAEQLLTTCQALENALGRVRSTHNAPRVIDVDVLLFGGEQIATPTLSVPHPRMHLRRFVLEPLVQLNPGVYIPGRGRASDSLLATADQDVRAI